MYMRDMYIVRCLARDILYLLSALLVMYTLLMYYISLLLLPPDGFVLCYIGLLVLTLWHFDDDVISPSPGKGRYMDILNLLTKFLFMSFDEVRGHIMCLLYSYAMLVP